MRNLIAALTLCSCTYPVPAAEPTHWLIVSVVMTDGSYQSMAVKHKNMETCEKDIPKALEMIQRNKEAIAGYVVVCSKVSDMGEAS